MIYVAKGTIDNGAVGIAVSFDGDSDKEAVEKFHNLFDGDFLPCDSILWEGGRMVVSIEEIKRRLFKGKP